MKKFFTFLCMLILTMSAWAQEASPLMQEAEELAADLDAVAVGKLLAAIDDAKESGDESQLQAAIDQFKADNADQEKDETAKVAVDYKKWTGASGFATWAAPQVTTYDGRTTYVVENYNGDTGAVTGEIFSQTITGLSTGSYKVAFFANANSTADRDAAVETGMADGADDVAYVFANDAQKFLVAHRAISITQNDEYAFEMELTEADNGTIKLGLGKAKAGTNWHTMQIKQLTWFTTAKAVYAADKEELSELLGKAESLAADETKTNGKDALNEAILDATPVPLYSNWDNIPELEARIVALKQAIDDFIKANYFIDFAAGEYYIIDAESGNMMAAGHDWGTHGIVNEQGLDLTLTPNAETRRVSIDSRVSNGGNQHYLGSNLYMDSDEFGWALDYQGFGFYITDGSMYISVDENDNLVMSETPREWIIVTKDGVMAQRLEELADATEESPKNASFLITAPNFNRNDARNNAWTVTVGQTGEGNSFNISGGNNVNNCAAALHTDFTISQSLSNAPKGTYKLMAQGFYRQDGEETEELPVLFAGDATAELPECEGEEDMVEASEAFTQGDYLVGPITFEYDGESELSIGITGTAEHQWVCFDNFVLVYLGYDEPNVLVELPEGVTPQTWTIEGKFRTNSAVYQVQDDTQLAFDGNDVYMQGLSYYFEDAWIKGTYDPSTGLIAFPSGQYVGEDEYGYEYMMGSYDGDVISDIIFEYDPEVQMMTLVNYVFENSSRSELSFFGYWFDVTYYAGEPIVLEPVDVPEDLVAEPYMLTALSLVPESDVWTDFTFQPQVGFDGNDVYFKGFSTDSKDMWAKGTMSDDGKTVTIPANQYIGTLDVMGIYSFDYFITAVDDEGHLVDLVLNYDAETSTFTTDQLLYINGSKLKLDYYEILDNVVISKMTDFAATPADPQVTSIGATAYFPYIKIHVPVKDTEGRLIQSEQLYYIIWYEKDGTAQQFQFTTADYTYMPSDMTEIPYNYGDDYDIYRDSEETLVYINGVDEDIKTTWTRIGIQSVYYGGGERHESNIVWTENEAVGIDDILADSSRERVIYDLQGRRVVAPAKGMYIVDGKKVFVK